MWKFFAGFIVFTLLALFIIMKVGDKVEIQDKAVAYQPVSKSPSIAAAAPTASVPAPAPVAPAAATPAASAASTDSASQPGKMSTTGTIVVGATAATSK